MKNYLIIGYGKVGTHLHSTFKNSVKDVNVKIIKSPGSKITKNDMAEANIILICTQDDKIPGAVKCILKTNAGLKGKIIVHTSGALTSDELIKLKKLFPQKIHLFGAYAEKQMIAGVVNFYCNDNVVLVFYISHNPEFQQYRAVNLLFYTIIKDSINRGLKFLDFGLFTVNMEPNWGLGKFKENFGARGILRDTYFLELVNATS